MESASAAGRHNVLLEGPLACTDAVLHLLKPYLGEPVTLKRSGAPLERHTSMRGALVVHDISAFSGPEQDRLLGWLDDPHSRTQVVCTTTEPLFPLVARGLFDETLYYRLNVILLQLTEVQASVIARLRLPTNAWSSTAERHRRRFPRAAIHELAVSLCRIRDSIVAALRELVDALD